MPVTLIGAGVFFAALAFMVQTFIAIDQHSASVSDTLYGWYPFAVSTFLGYHWLAGNLAGIKR